MLRYKVLANGTGVLLTRTPRGLMETLTIWVDGAQAGDRLVLTRQDDKTIYRTLKDGKCVVSSALLYGMVLVTLLQSGGAAVTCEPLFCEDVDGVRLVVPADMDLPGRVVQLETQVDEILTLRAQVANQAEELLRLRRGLAAVANWIQTQEEKGELLI